MSTPPKKNYYTCYYKKLYNLNIANKKWKKNL